MFKSLINISFMQHMHCLNIRNLSDNCYSLIVQCEVWFPYLRSMNSDSGDVVIILRVPRE